MRQILSNGGMWTPKIIRPMTHHVVYQITKRHRWVRGPDFLWHPESEWPKFPRDLDAVSADDPEVKKVVTHATVFYEKAEILTRFARFSDWNHMKRCVAQILRLKQFFTHVQMPLETRRAKNAKNFGQPTFES